MRLLWSLSLVGALVAQVAPSHVALSKPIQVTTAQSSIAFAPGSSPYAQLLPDEAILQPRQPLVQWTPVGDEEWQAVAEPRRVQPGDRLRTGPNGSALLVYPDETGTEIGPATGLIVRRLVSIAGPTLAPALYQAVGMTISRVVLDDASARFEVETPAATVRSRVATIRVQVGTDGFTRVANLPGGAGGLVEVQSKDQRGISLRIAPGEEAGLAPGQPPAVASVVAEVQGLGRTAEWAVQAQAGLALTQAALTQQAVAGAQVAQAQSGMAAAQSELALLRDSAIAARVAQLLPTVVALARTSTPTPSSTPTPFVPTATPTPAVVVPSPQYSRITAPSPTVSLSANGGSVPITAVVRDNSNLPIANVQVLVAANSGTISPIQAPTDALGVAIFRLIGTAGAFVTVTATVNGVPIGATTVLLLP